MSQLKRRDLRIAVMQVLYAHEISKDPIDKVKKDLLPEIGEEESSEFVNQLIDLVLKNEELLDKMILEKVVNWELERMALIDKIVLRMGVTELLYFPEIPPKVSINEAIDISKDYCTRNSGKFVNGILDAILDDLKKEEKLNKSGRGLLNLKKKSGNAPQEKNDQAV
ncbi:MAG: transcription antitermination factor NusB [Ignavibacteria bacterium]|jgi:N utilization substance protein B|nr:transcription antitermination factor NusB [Ignavibacteria bacterium]MBK6875722.1 transcription antitermination factor NusB [Ignavibacteria bacterium]MBK9226132.1 transcription antitermination factor NusB [Ignavibacteria bacterium]